jgi:hypothetical protein
MHLHPMHLAGAVQSLLSSHCSIAAVLIWVWIFCDGGNWIDFAGLIAADLSGPNASG